MSGKEGKNETGRMSGMLATTFLKTTYTSGVTEPREQGLGREPMLKKRNRSPGIHRKPRPAATHLAHHDDLLGLLLHRQGADQRRHLLRRLPLRQLAEPLLPGPHAGMDHLQEQLSWGRQETNGSAH